jgi:hypothetical protein
MARVVLEIFLSSTSDDLGDYRSTVAEVLERFRQAVLRMESFGARPAAPLPTCRERVRRSDVLIVLVGHRYGWIPSEAEGGDGVKSITWWEVEWALEAGKPVYAFLIDPQAPWTGAREQDAQVTLVERDDAGSLRVQVMGFGLKVAKTVMRVLFFRSQKNQTSLRYVAADAAINASVLAAVRETIAAKLAQYTGYVRGFDV